MSFRHTYITEFLYKVGRKDELNRIKKKLSEYGTVHWKGKDNMGYFHGVIKDLDNNQTRVQYHEISNDLAKNGVRIKIVFE